MDGWSVGESATEPHFTEGPVAFEPVDSLPRHKVHSANNFCSSDFLPSHPFNHFRVSDLLSRET